MRVQGHAHAAVADGVEVDLQARPIRRHHRCVQALGSPVGHAEAERRIVGVGREHGGGVGFDHAVHVGLDPAATQQGVVVQGEEPPRFGDGRLVGPLLHLHGGRDPHRELPLAKGTLEQRDLALQGRAIRAGVLHGGDALGVELAERAEQEAIAGLGVGPGDLGLHERACHLLEGSRGLAGAGVADDHAILGILGALRDAGEGQGLRVRPAAVPVVALHVGGTVGHHRVELRLRGKASRERAVEPPVAADPGRPGIDAREGLDAALHRLQGLVFDEIDLVQGQSALDEVDVGVVEAREHQAPPRIQDLGLRPTQGRRLCARAHGDQPAAAHREGLGPGVLRLGGPDAAIREHDVGGRLRSQGGVREEAGEEEEIRGDLRRSLHGSYLMPANRARCPATMRWRASSFTSRLSTPRSWVPPSRIPSRRGNM